ncbi:hypothetical protein [Laceyella putida]|uniref:Uncharacterized protein n=1 Tax=Laceyella putida TaxID=110101 RepID=A0ABW2RNH5_9BACL
MQEREIDLTWCETFFPEDIIDVVFEGSEEEFYEYDKAVHFFIREQPVELDCLFYDEEKGEVRFRLFKRAGRTVPCK